MSKPIIYAIVVTYNGAKWVDKCFGSLMESNIPVKVLAIDNASTDKTVELIKSKYPSVELIENGTNLGFGKANNIGLKRILYENADYAFLLNQDAYIFPTTIAALIDAHKRNYDYGIFSPLEYCNTGELDKKFERFYAPKELLANMHTTGQNLFQTEFVNAACWLIPKKIIQIIGGFDPIFSHYGEDVDYCKRVRSKQFKIGIVKNSKYVHDRPQALIKDSPIQKKISDLHVSQLLFLRWSNLSLSKRLIIILKQNLKNALFTAPGYKKQILKHSLFLGKNFNKILNQEVFKAL
jgi:GT2 family glycosyltransferase